MNFPLLGLELRKNRLAAASVVAAFVITLPVSRLVASATGMESANALSTILLAWTFLGVPFAAVLIGATAGAGTASAGSRGAEALLPASPARRAGASLGAALALLAAVAAVIVAAALLGNALAPYLLPADQAYNWGRPFWEKLPKSPFFLAFVADVLAASWALAYLTGHGVAGGLLGPSLVAFELLGLAVGAGLRLEQGEWVPWNGSTDVDLAFLAGLAAFKFAAIPFAARLERRPSPALAAWAKPAVWLLAGPAAACAAAGWLAWGTWSRMLPIMGGRLAYQSWSEDGGMSPAAREAGNRELILHSVRGGLFAAGPSGTRVLIPEDVSGVFDLVFRAFDRARVISVERAEDGTLWATRTIGMRMELWRQDGDAMKLVFADTRDDIPRLDRVARRLYWRRWNLQNAASEYVPVGEFARLGRKAAALPGLDAAIKAGSTGVARIGGPKGDILTKGSKTWKLPGPAESTMPAYPHWVGGKPAYLVPTITKTGAAVVALAREDGKVETAWRTRRRGFYDLPDGTIFAYAEGDRIGIIDADGRVSSLRYGRLAAEGQHGAPGLLRRLDGRSWLIWDSCIVETDANGKLVSRTRLPDVDAYAVVRDGLIYDSGRRWWFRSWDGTTRPLAKPRA